MLLTELFSFLSTYIWNRFLCTLLRNRIDTEPWPVLAVSNNQIQTHTLIVVKHPPLSLRDVFPLKCNFIFSNKLLIWNNIVLTEYITDNYNNSIRRNYSMIIGLKVTGNKNVNINLYIFLLQYSKIPVKKFKHKNTHEKSLYGKWKFKLKFKFREKKWSK